MRALWITQNTSIWKSCLCFLEMLWVENVGNCNLSKWIKATVLILYSNCFLEEGVSLFILDTLTSILLAEGVSMTGCISMSSKFLWLVLFWLWALVSSCRGTFLPLNFFFSSNETALGIIFPELLNGWWTNMEVNPPKDFCKTFDLPSLWGDLINPSST